MSRLMRIGTRNNALSISVPCLGVSNAVNLRDSETLPILSQCGSDGTVVTNSYVHAVRLAKLTTETPLIETRDSEHLWARGSITTSTTSRYFCVSLFDESP